MWQLFLFRNRIVIDKTSCFRGEKTVSNIIYCFLDLSLEFESSTEVKQMQSFISLLVWVIHFFLDTYSLTDTDMI